MATCLHDNPRTCRREVWCDGELEASYSSELVMACARRLPWNPGAMIGDESAMPARHADQEGRSDG